MTFWLTVYNSTDKHTEGLPGLMALTQFKRYSERYLSRTMAHFCLYCYILWDWSPGFHATAETCVRDYSVIVGRTSLYWSVRRWVRWRSWGLDTITPARLRAGSLTRSLWMTWKRVEFMSSRVVAGWQRTRTTDRSLVNCCVAAAALKVCSHVFVNFRFVDVQLQWT